MKKLLDFYDKLLCTGLGTGYWPWGPGTLAAAIATVLWCLLWYYYFPFDSLITSIVTIVAVTLISVPSINRLEFQWGPDPKRVVIDEVVGVWIALMAVPMPEFCDFLGYTEEWYIPLAFILFRLFDIFKPLGIRDMEYLPGGWGVMADDILAGIYSFIILVFMEWYINWGF